MFQTHTRKNKKKTVLREIKEFLNQCKDMFMIRRLHKMSNCPQNDAIPNQDPCRFFSVKINTIKIYMEMQRSKVANNLAKEEWSWRTSLYLPRLNIKLQKSRQCGTGIKSDKQINGTKQNPKVDTPIGGQRILRKIQS